MSLLCPISMEISFLISVPVSLEGSELLPREILERYITKKPFVLHMLDLESLMSYETTRVIFETGNI